MTASALVRISGVEAERDRLREEVERLRAEVESLRGLDDEDRPPLQVSASEERVWRAMYERRCYAGEEPASILDDYGFTDALQKRLAVFDALGDWQTFSVLAQPGCPTCKEWLEILSARTRAALEQPEAK